MRPIDYLLAGIVGLMFIGWVLPPLNEWLDSKGLRGKKPATNSAPTQQQHDVVPGRMLRQPRARALFLDFDGVLHPGNSGTLVHIARVENFLRLRPDVDVIISSSWRLEQPLEELVQLFAEDVQWQIAGCTGQKDTDFQREVEIRLTVAEFGIALYSALDDDRTGFHEGFKNLVLTDSLTGVTAQDLRRVDEMLGA